MPREIKIFLSTLLLCILGYAGFQLFKPAQMVQIDTYTKIDTNSREMPPTHPKSNPAIEDPNNRTLYEGQVEFEQITLGEIDQRLSAKNIYHVVKENSIEVFPFGPAGFGYLSFTITDKLIKATKDIPGTPDLEKYKEEIRQDIKNTGSVITIKEDTWKILKTTYPWDVIY